MAKGDRDDEDMAPAPAPRGSPPSSAGRRRAPPKRKGPPAEEQKSDARARRRRAREPSSRGKTQDPLGAAARFVDLTRRLAAGGADASPGLELEALAKLLYALTQRGGSTGKERSLSARALSAARDALLALSSQRGEDDDAAPASRTRAQKAQDVEDAPQPLDRNAQLCAGACLELCVEMVEGDTMGVVCLDPAAARRAALALDVLEELCGGPPSAPVDLPEAPSTSRIQPFEDLLATTLHSAAARVADRLRRMPPAKDEDLRRPSPAVRRLAAAHLVRLEAPRRLLRCADAGLKAAGGTKPGDVMMDADGLEGDRASAINWASRLARVARLVEDCNTEDANALVSQAARNAVEQACFDVAARLGALAALTANDGPTHSNGWRNAHRRRVSGFIANDDEPLAQTAVSCFRAISAVAASAKHDAPRPFLVSAVGAAAIFRASGPLASRIVEGFTKEVNASSDRMPPAIAAFALTAITEAAQHNCVAPLASDARASLDGCCACALAGAVSNDDDLGALGLKALAALLGPPQEPSDKKDSKKRRRAPDDDRKPFRDDVSTAHAVAVFYAAAWDATTDLSTEAPATAAQRGILARWRARGDRAWLSARSASRAVADALHGDALRRAREELIMHASSDGAIDATMPRKALAPLYDIILDRGEGDADHLGTLASLLLGDGSRDSVCPLTYAPHGARFLVDALSSPRRDAVAAVVVERLWDVVSRLNDDDDLRTAARVLHVARAALEAAPSTSAFLADRLRGDDSNEDDDEPPSPGDDALYAALKGASSQEPPKRARRTKPAKKVMTLSTLVEGKRIADLRRAAAGVLASARDEASRFGVDAAWRFLAALPEVAASAGMTDGLDGVLAASRLARLLDASETRLGPGDAVLTSARIELRASLNDLASDAWASAAAVEALAFALRAAVAPSRGGRYRLHDGDSDVDEGSDSDDEDDEETADRAAQRARTSAFVDELVQALQVACARHDACVIKALEGAEPAKRRRSKKDDDAGGDARLARCLLRAAGADGANATPHAAIFEPPASKLAKLGRALFFDGNEEDGRIVKTLADRLLRRGADVKVLGAELRGVRGSSQRARCAVSVDRRIVVHALESHTTARVVAAVAAAARAVALTARRQHLRAGASVETPSWATCAAALGALKNDAAYGFCRGLCATASQQLARRPSEARAVDCKRRLGATAALFDNVAKSEGVWASARAAALDDLERWTSSPRAEHRQHVVQYVEGKSDEKVGAEKLLHWALEDDLAQSLAYAHLACAARVVVAASQFPDATSGCIRLPAAKALSSAPPGALRAALVASKDDTAAICELCASAACGDAKGVDGRYPAATGAASFVAGRGDEDAGWAPAKTAKKGTEVWAVSCRAAILRALVDDGDVNVLLELPARASRPCEALLVLCCVAQGGASAAAVAQTLVHTSGQTLGSARALELAAALCAGFRRALGLSQEAPLMPDLEPEETQLEVPTKCTFASASGAFVEQHWYNCATCGLVGDKGACAACIRTCHAGHDISYARKSSFFCDCGARGSSTAADRAAQREREAFLGGSDMPGRRGVSAAALLAAAPPCRCLTGEQRFRRPPPSERRPPKQDRARLLRRVENLAATTRQASLPASLALAACTVSTSLATQAALTLAERVSRPRSCSVVAPRRPKAALQPSPGRGRTAKGAAESATQTRSAPKVRRVACISTIEVKVPGDQATGPVARQTKALLARHRLAPRLISADRRGRVAVGCRRTITVYVLENALRARRPQRAACVALSKVATPFDLVGLAFNPSCDRHVAAWGLREVCVVALDGGKKKDTEEITPTTVKVELALDALASDAAHVVRCLWVPASKCGLAVATTLGVHIYDLSRDAATPTHAYVLAYDQHHLRDACLAPPRPEWGGARALYAVLDTGRVFAADVEPDEWSAERTVREVYLDLHDALPLPPRLLAGAGPAHGLLYSSRAHALIIARDGAAACVVPLGDGVRDVRGGGSILPAIVPAAPAQRQAQRPGAHDELLLAALTATPGQRKTAQQPFDAWLEWPGGEADENGDAMDVVCVAWGVVRPAATPSPRATERVVYVACANLADDASRISVARELDCTEPGPAPPLSTAAQRLAAATGGATTPPHRRVLGVTAYMPPRSSKSAARQLMVLFDDGSLQLFDRPDCDPADVSMDEDDEDDDEEEELMRRGPATCQFEQLAVVPPQRVSFGGDLGTTKPSHELRRRLRAASDEYLVSAKPDGESLMVTVDAGFLAERGSLRAVRILVGNAVANHASEELVICGKVTQVRTSGRQWRDVFLNAADRRACRRLGGVPVSMLGARRAGNPPILDAVEVYVADEDLRRLKPKKKVLSEVCQGAPLKRCLAAAARVAALVSHPASSNERFPPLQTPFDDLHAAHDMADAPGALAQAALKVVERTCLTTTSDRAWARAAATLCRVTCGFDVARTSACIDAARLDRLCAATAGALDDARADAVAKLALALHAREPIAFRQRLCASQDDYGFPKVAALAKRGLTGDDDVRRRAATARTVVALACAELWQRASACSQPAEAAREGWLQLVPTLETADTADAASEALADEIAAAFLRDPAGAAAALRGDDTSESKAEDVLEESKEDAHQSQAGFFASCVLPLVLDRLKQHVVVACLDEGTMHDVGTPGAIARGLGGVLRIASASYADPHLAAAVSFTLTAWASDTLRYALCHDVVRCIQSRKGRHARQFGKDGVEWSGDREATWFERKDPARDDIVVLLLRTVERLCRGVPGVNRAPGQPLTRRDTMESQDCDDEDRVAEAGADVDACTRRCAGVEVSTCVPRGLNISTETDVACRAAARAARRAVAAQLDTQDNGVSLRDAVVAKCRRALSALRIESEGAHMPKEAVEEDDPKPALLRDDASDDESIPDESDGEDDRVRFVQPTGLLDDAIEDSEHNVEDDDVATMEPTGCPWWVPLIAAPERDAPRSTKLRRNPRAELACAFLAASLRCCASAGAALTSSDTRFPPAFLAALCDAVGDRNLPKGARRAARRALRRLCGGSPREYRACRDSHLFARHFARLRAALGTITRDGELEYVAAARLEHSLTRLLRVVRARAHHWRTFCARPALGAEPAEDCVMIDQDEDDDDASLADESDGEETFARGACGGATLLALCDVLPASRARDAVLELLERCCRPLAPRDTNDDDLRLEDQRAGAERDGALRAQSRPRRRFARFLGLGAPAEARAGASRAAQGLVLDLGAAAAPRLLAFAAAIAVDGDSRGCRALGAQTLRHVWRALDRPAKTLVLAALARRAPLELRRSGGGELLAALRGTLVDAIDDREILPASTLDALCVSIAAGLKAARADLNDDVRAVYVATDGLCRQQPRCFDDSMNNDEDKELLRAASEADATANLDAGPVVDDFDGSCESDADRVRYCHEGACFRSSDVVDEVTARDRSQSLLSEPEDPESDGEKKKSSNKKKETPGKKEAPLQQLEDLAKASRYTENTAVSQLRTVRRITHLELRIREPRVRYVRRLKLYYAAREVDSLSDLSWPQHQRKWALAATVRLERGQTAARIPLPAPLVAANLLIKYDNFYPQRTTGPPQQRRAGSKAHACLHCPRCGRAVTDAHGVCQHCGEVAFQCRQCRHINYERLDAFLCVECGYCAFGDFSYRLRSDSAPDALSIRSEEDLARAVARLRDRADACADARRELRRLLPECARRARAVAAVATDADGVFAAWPRRAQAPEEGRWAAVDAASFALMAHADARALGTPRAAATLSADLGALLSVVTPSAQGVARLFGVDEDEELPQSMPPLDLGLPARASASLASMLASARDSGPKDARRLALALEGVPRRRVLRRRFAPPPSLLGGSSYAAALAAARRAVRSPPGAAALLRRPARRALAQAAAGLLGRYPRATPVLGAGRGRAAALFFRGETSSRSIRVRRSPPEDDEDEDDDDPMLDEESADDEMLQKALAASAPVPPRSFDEANEDSDVPPGSSDDDDDDGIYDGEDPFIDIREEELLARGFDGEESEEEPRPEAEEEAAAARAAPTVDVGKARREQRAKRDEAASLSLDRVYAAAAAAAAAVRGPVSRKKREQTDAPKSPPHSVNVDVATRELVKAAHAEDARSRKAVSDDEENDEDRYQRLGAPARSLLELYEGECAPLAAELRSAAKQAAQTVARVRAYRRRTHTEEVDSASDDDQLSLSHAATAGRLAALAGALAASERGRSALDAHRVVGELLAVTSSGPREASRAAAQALRTLAAHSAGARQHVFDALRGATTDALADPHALGARSRDCAPLGRALSALRDHVGAPMPDGSLHAAVVAFCLEVVPRAALSTDAAIAEAVLRPCLGVLCKVASSDDAAPVLAWLRREAARLPLNDEGPWRSLARFSRWTGSCTFSVTRVGALRDAFGKWRPRPQTHWWLRALTCPASDACRRQAALLLLAACGNDLETGPQVAAVEFALEAFATACADGTGDVSQLVVVVKELVSCAALASSSTTKRRAYIQKRGFGRCCARLARREASLLLSRDARLLRDARGGADGAAARAVARGASPALEALCVLASELGDAPEEDEDAEGAAGRVARDALEVPLEACLALRALGLLGCRATDQAADSLALAARVPLDCDCRGPSPVEKRRGDRLAFLAASCRVLRRRRDRRLGTLMADAPPPLDASAVDLLLKDMASAATPKRQRQKVQLQLRRAPTQEEFFRGNLPRSIVDLDDVPAETAGEDAEVLMRDVRRKIAKDLDMVDAAEMLELLVCDRIISLDLSVRQVHANVWAPGAKDARTRARRRRMGALAAALGDAAAAAMDVGGVDEDDDEDELNEEEDEVLSDEDDPMDEDDEDGQPSPRRRRLKVTPPMVITYRLTGVDGEATEDTYDTIEAEDDAERKADQKAAANVIAAASGLDELVKCCSNRDASELAPRALQLLALCAGAGYASDLAKRGASGALLTRLVSELQNKKSQQSLVPRILGLLETLAPEAVGAAETDDNDGEGHLEVLVEGLKDEAVASALARTPALRRAVCRLLPALAYGRTDAADALAKTIVQLFDSGVETWAQESDGPASVAAACLREVVEGLGEASVGARALGDALDRAGFAKKAAAALAALLPSQAPKFVWASKGEACQAWCDKAGGDGERIVIVLLKALRGCCAASEKCAKTALKSPAIEQAHALELLLTPPGVCLAAEACVDAVASWPSGGRATAMRKASRDARLGHAQKCRGRLLKRLGLPAPPTGGSPAPQRRARAPSVTENVRDDEPDDAGSARCVVCREGFASRPRDALGAYVFSKLAAADVGGADGFQLVEGAVAVRWGARPPPAVASSVGAMHCIHANCHRDATRAERSLRSPRAEWDGAALRNSRVLCNSILPVRPPQNIEDWASARAAYHATVERHFGRVAQLGVAPAPASQLAAASATMSYASPSARALRSSRFQLAAHDARLLLLRLAHNEPLHQESGGGSRRSNLELCLYLLQLAGHQLQDRELGGAADPAIAQRERRHLDTVITASLDRAQGSADNGAKAAEAAPHAALLTLFATSNNRWSAERKRRTCARALKRSVDRAKSRAAASAAARGRRRAGSVSHGNPSPPGSPPLMPVVTAAGAPAPAAAAAELEAATAARAITYARAALAFVALIDKLHGALETPLMPSENLIPPTDCTSLFSGDDASIARCAAELATFYDSELRDTENPLDVLRVMDLDADALELDAETRSMVFGS